MYICKKIVLSQKSEILSVMRRHQPRFALLGVSRIGLFGSNVRNRASANSDIDILVDFYPEKETFDNFMTLCDSLEEIFEGKKVDVVTMNGLSPHIGPEILKEVVYA